MERDAATMFELLTTKTVVSVVFIAIVLGIRLLLARWLSRKASLPAEQRRKWLVRSRNAFFLVIAAGLIFIWVNELRTLAVSMLAIAVALVLATKELILCFSGAVLRKGTDAYDLGDRIEVAGMRGEVMDMTFLGTSLREIGPGKTGQQYTGKSIVVPHSLLLNNPVINETFTGEFQLHLFTVPWRLEDDWQRAERLLLEAAEIETEPILETARRHMKVMEERHGIEPPTVDSKVTLEMSEPGRIDFKVRVPVAAGRINRTEQAIMRRFLTAFGGLQGGGTKAAAATDTDKPTSR